MNKNNSLVAILLVIVIVLLGYIAFKPKDTATVASLPSTQTPTGQTTTINNPNGTDYQPGKTTNKPADPNLVTKSDWGVSLTKASGWALTSNTSGKVLLTEVSQPGDEISVDYVSGTTITDTDSKFGSITYLYDSTKQMWMETDNEEGEGVSPHPTPVQAIAVMYTADGLPVFKGTARWETFIVPLSHTTFLRLNIGGSGYSQPLNDLVKTIKKS
jgi:hypothetical protein